MIYSKLVNFTKIFRNDTSHDATLKVERDKLLAREFCVTMETEVSLEGAIFKFL